MERWPKYGPCPDVARLDRPVVLRVIDFAGDRTGATYADFVYWTEESGGGFREGYTIQTDVTFTTVPDAVLRRFRVRNVHGLEHIDPTVLEVWDRGVRWTARNVALDGEGRPRFLSIDADSGRTHKGANLRQPPALP